VKRLIVNADDLGLTNGVNQAIVRAHAAGVVTSATLMANSAAFDEAVALASANPGLSVGCHVVLLDGAPLSQPERVSSLLRTRREFFTTIGQFAPRALLSHFRPEEIKAEARVQFEKLRHAGISISHFDAHKHAHMFPSVLGPILEAAREAGIRAVRNPFEPAATLPFSAVAGSKKMAIRSAEVAVLRTLRSAFMSSVRKAGLVTPDGSIGVAATGSLNLGLLQQMIERLPEGTWELVCHPGYNDGELASVRTSLKASRQYEFELLTSPVVRETLERNGVELISFREFAS
jgi:hopanoid biosynthesis associated protein HpnK